MKHSAIGAIAVAAAIAAAIAVGGPSGVAQAAPAEQQLGAEQLVELALAANPQVHAARARWTAAEHSIRQSYAPADPIFGYANIDSPTNGITNAAAHSLSVFDSFQFPGKAILQGEEAERAAQIARLQYQAMLRDTRAAVETAYFQLLLDRALAAVNGENIDNLTRVLKVTQVAYSASQVTQTDFISAELDLATARLQQRQLGVAISNDETTLNQILNRSPGSPLNLDETISLDPLNVSVDNLIERAFEARQEILAAAAAEKNSETALRLARLEYLPDYTVGYTFDNYLIPSAGPTVNSLQDHGFSFAFNLPVFFWLKQNEDVKRADADVEAARGDLESIHSQTAASVTNLYRNTMLAYGSALLYRDSLIALAREDFEVALVAYESRQIDFVMLSGALKRSYDARVGYLQAANQFLASRISLEQAIGASLPR